jgi:3-hydroxyisobutyrate dehydrogenase
MSADADTSAIHRVAVLGTGIMGAPIARNLLRAGFEVRVWNRTPDKAEKLIADGAISMSSPASAAAGADAVITMLTDGAAVNTVMSQHGGALSALDRGVVWIQMGTVGVDWCDRLGNLAARRGVFYVDAPVSGSSRLAETGQLEILASGAGSVRSRLTPIFDALGRRTVWLERVGDASRLKLALNNWLAVLVEGMVETLTLCRALGLDPHAFVGAVDNGPLASPYAIAKANAMLDEDFLPGFPLRHAAKDAALAVAAAHNQGAGLPLTAVLLRVWHRAIAAGHGDEDVSAAVIASQPTRRQPVLATTTNQK